MGVMWEGVALRRYRWSGAWKQVGVWILTSTLAKLIAGFFSGACWLAIAFARHAPFPLLFRLSRHDHMFANEASIPCQLVRTADGVIAHERHGARQFRGSYAPPACDKKDEERGRPSAVARPLLSR